MTWYVVEHPNGWTVQDREGGGGKCLAQSYGDATIEDAARIVNALNEVENVVLRQTAEGSLHFMRTGVDSPSRGIEDDSRCICCDGPHIFGLNAKLEDVQDFWGKPVTDISTFAHNFLWFKFEGKPVYEGKRFRVTVSVLEPEPERADSSSQ